MTSLYAGGADIVSVGPGEAPAVKNLLIMSASFSYCKRCSPQGLREGGWVGVGGGWGGGGEVTRRALTMIMNLFDNY